MNHSDIDVSKQNINVALPEWVRKGWRKAFASTTFFNETYFLTSGRSQSIPKYIVGKLRSCLIPTHRAITIFGE
jgi:hypothetical protein